MLGPFTTRVAMLASYVAQGPIRTRRDRRNVRHVHPTFQAEASLEQRAPANVLVRFDFQSSVVNNSNVIIILNNNYVNGIIDLPF